MTLQQFYIKKGNIAVISPILNIDSFDNIKKLNNISLLIINSSLFGLNDSEELLKEKLLLLKSINALYVMGSKDYLLFNKIKYNKNLFDLSNFMLNKPNIICQTFDNQTNYFITAGGIMPKHKEMFDLIDDMEISFIKTNWHLLYNGRFGYGISNMPYYENPKIFDFSRSIGSINHTNCQIFDEKGFKEIITI